jgi:hypothetical protein
MKVLEKPTVDTRCDRSRMRVQPLPQRHIQPFADVRTRVLPGSYDWRASCCEEAADLDLPLHPGPRLTPQRSPDSHDPREHRCWVQTHPNAVALSHHQRLVARKAQRSRNGHRSSHGVGRRRDHPGILPNRASRRRSVVIEIVLTGCAIVTNGHILTGAGNAVRYFPTPPASGCRVEERRLSEPPGSV